MFKRWGVLFLAATVMLSCQFGRGASDEGEKGNQYSSTQGFVVHEWGVLVSKGSGPAAAGSDLPPFVTWMANESGMADARKPVIHLYAPEEKEVSVSVALGRIGDYCVWPPLSARAEENERRKNSREISPAAVQIEWGSVKVLPPLVEKPALREVEKNCWWDKARSVPSNYLNVGGEHERFLFYEVAAPAYSISVNLKHTETGLQLIDPLASKRSDHLPENWDQPSELAHFFLVEISGKTGRVFYSASAEAADDTNKVLAVEWGKDHEFDLASEDWKAATMFRLQRLLEEAGLYTDEAAMVADVWDRDFFQTEGARVIYFMPRATYDKLFPITVDQKPDVLERVMLVCVNE